MRNDEFNRIRNEIVEGLRQHKGEISVSSDGLEEARFRTIMRSLPFDFPELFFYYNYRYRKGVRPGEWTIFPMYFYDRITTERKQEKLAYQTKQILDKVSKQRLDKKKKKSYKEARQILTKKGWDLAKYPEDEELLRTVFNLEREGTRAGHQIYKKYVETVLSRTIHNEIDRDNVYKDFQHFLHENNLHRYKNVESLDKFIGAVIYSSKEEVEMCQRKTAEKNLSKNVNNGSKISVKGRGR